MENPTPKKILIGILFVFGVGIVAVTIQNMNPRQMATDSYMLTTKALSEKAREACPEAVRKHTNVILGLPNDTVSDGQRQVTLNWKGGGAAIRPWPAPTSWTRASWRSPSTASRSVLGLTRQAGLDVAAQGRSPMRAIARLRILPVQRRRREMRATGSAPGPRRDWPASGSSRAVPRPGGAPSRAPRAPGTRCGSSR